MTESKRRALTSGFVAAEVTDLSERLWCCNIGSSWIAELSTYTCGTESCHKQQHVTYTEREFIPVTQLTLGTSYMFRNWTVYSSVHKQGHMHLSPPVLLLLTTFPHFSNGEAFCLGMRHQVLSCYSH